MQNLNIGKVCLVGEAVAVGFVGETVMVGEAVGENVLVGSSVNVAVGVAVCEGVGVGVSGGGVNKYFHVNASRRTIPMMMGIAYLRSVDESIAAVLLNGITSGGLPVYPRGDRSLLKLSAYSPLVKLTKLIVFKAKGTLQEASMMGMIFLRKLNAWVYSLRTHSDSMELGVRTTIIYLLSAMAMGIVFTQSSPPRRSVISHHTSYPAFSRSPASLLAKAISLRE